MCLNELYFMINSIQTHLITNRQNYDNLHFKDGQKDFSVFLMLKVQCLVVIKVVIIHF